MTASRRLIAMLVVLAAVVAAPGAQAAAGDWSMWGFSRAGTRFNPFEHTITPQNVGRLQLKWAFVFSGADAASASLPS